MARNKNKQNIEIKSEESLTVDTRKSGGINVDGNLKVNSQKDLTIIGDGESSEEIDKNIKKVLRDEDALGLYESNKKYGPTVTFSKEKYKAETIGFVMKNQHWYQEER